MGHSLKSRLFELATAQPSSWSIVGPGARPSMHGFVRYPAMMVPAMQGDIIDAVLEEVGGRCRIVDPFVGSGTVMTEALARGRDFLGIDINPLAILICEAKAALDRGLEMTAVAERLRRRDARDCGATIDVDFSGRDKWFEPDVCRELSRLRRSIAREEEGDCRKVMWTVLAETIRLCSNSRTSTYKLHVRLPHARVSGAQLRETFFALLDRAAGHSNRERASRVGAIELVCGDVRQVSLTSGMNVHDIVVTSPPYGDNRTTVPYGQFSYLALQWISANDLCRSTSAFRQSAYSLDAKSLGGSLRRSTTRDEKAREASPSLHSFLHAMSREGELPGYRKVACFMSDFFDGLQRLALQTAPKSHWVVTTGNRTVAGRVVPFDRICQEMLENLGANHVASIRRHLPNKRMPVRNSMGSMITSENTLVAEFRRRSPNSDAG